MPVVTSPDVLGGPRLKGRRVSFMQVAEMVLDGDHSPECVADRLGVSLAEVHEALAYYYNHPDEMEEVERRHEDCGAELREQSDAPRRATR